MFVRCVNEHSALSICAEDAIETGCESVQGREGRGIVDNEVVAVVVACMYIIALEN